MAQQSTVTKIYELKTIGYRDRHNEFKTLSEDLTKIKKLLLELKGMKLTVGDGNALVEVNKKIEQAEELQGRLQTQLKQNISLREQESVILRKVGSDQGNLTNAYYKLLQQAREAATNARNLAAAHGVESEQAKAAAIAAGEYKAKLDEINRLVKSGGVTPTIPVQKPEVPFTTNLDDLEKEKAAIQQTGAVVNDLDREQAEAANSATAMGTASKEAAAGIASESAAVIESQTRFQQYTGTIRQNIEAQLENNMALAANRAEQKQIEKAIADSGTATNAQISRLAALTEEEQILVETNKALTITIRNQTKELIASAGSLDEMQAQLNQLQQSYEALSDAEKASPFGQEMKKEIDQLEPKVKSLEAELGKFQRNVGNYPKAFGGAFQTLNTELSKIQAKIVSGNFSGKELEQLTAQETLLNGITKNLGKEFTSTAAASQAFREAGRQLAQEFGQDSLVFKQFSSQVKGANQELKSTDAQMSTSTKKSKNLFTVIYGGLRTIANILPGVGISGVLLLIPNALNAAYAGIKKAFTEARESGEEFKRMQKEISAISEEAAKGLGYEYGQLELLRVKLNDTNIPASERIKVAKQYNEIADKNNQIDIKQIDNLALINNAISSQIDLIKKRAIARAAENIIAERANSLLLAEEKARQANLEQSNQIVDEAVYGTTIQKVGDRVVTGKTGEATQEYLKQFQREEQLAKLISRDPKVKKAKADLETALQAAVSLVDIDTLFSSKTSNDKTKKATASKLSAQQKDAIKEIEALRDRLLAVFKQMRLENQIDEESFLSREYAINVNAINRKLELLKGTNAEEKKVISQLNLEKVKLEQDLADKVFDIRSKTAKDQLDIISKNAQEQADLVKNDNNASEFQKAEAQLKADQAILAAQQEFNRQMDELEKERNTTSKKNAEDRGREIRASEQKITKDQKDLLLARIEDSKKAGEKLQAEFELSIDKGIALVQADTNLSQSQKQAKIRILENERQYGVLVRQAAAYTELQDLFKKAYDAGVVTLAQYDEVVKKLNELQGKIANAPESPSSGKGFFDGVKLGFGDNIIDYLQKAGQEFGKKLFGDTEQGENAGKAAALLISQSYSLAQGVMNNYFDAEQARIRQNLELQLERIDMEKEQVLARAQSQAEIDSLEKQYEAKKKAAEKKAQEDMKRSRRSEAKIALAAELANIWATVWTLGPIAGPIAGGVFSALALARYGLRVAEINREQFAKGGIPKDGGEIKGPSHKQGGVPFSMHKFEAQGKELAIINKRSAEDGRVRTITGTNKQIASAVNELGGGVSFAHGAKVKSFAGGGYLGQSLQPPIWQPSSNTIIAATDNSDIVNEIKEMKSEIKALTQEQSARIDRIKVEVSEQAITNAQKKKIKQSSIGTL